jgi:hypothetical protein
MSATFEVVTNDTYTMTPADFRNCVVVTDPASGREYAVGETWTGLHTRTAINVPLCKGCDDPVPADGVCSSCEVIHADIADANGIGDPLKRRAA